MGKDWGDGSGSKFCGFETEFLEDVPRLLSLSLSSLAALDLDVALLMDLTYGAGLIVNDCNGFGVLPVAGSNLALSLTQWSSHIMVEVLDIIHVSKEDQESVFVLLAVVSWMGNASFAMVDD